MPPKRSASGRKAVRHLHAVPDDAQPAMWDVSELDRLARLRQLAVTSHAPEDAIRLIDQAETADEAIGVLTDAGLIPTQAETNEELLACFTPLLEPGRGPLEAELCGAEFIGQLSRAAPPNVSVTDVLSNIIESFASRRTKEVLAMMRSLAAVAPIGPRDMAREAAEQMVHDGVPDMPWAADIGWPVPGRCFGFADIYGYQRSVVVTFSYGRSVHALIVLIDYQHGGGIKDCYIVDYTEAIRQHYQRVGRDPDLRYRDLELGEARVILAEALSAETCPVEPDQVEHVENYIGLVVVRTAALPALARTADRRSQRAATSGAAAGSTTRRQSPAKNVHRLKVTLRGVKPPIWRRFEVPSDTTLERLHRVIQASFPWLDYHFHVFDTAVGRYGTPDPDGGVFIFNDAYKKLSAVADWPGDRLLYTYDFGDNWELDIVVEAVLPAEPGVAYPRYTGGRRAGPPEDSGGPGGYLEILKVLANPRHEDHASILDWLGIDTAAEYDPDAFNIEVVNADLTRRVLIRS